MSYGLNLGWEGPIGDYIGFGGDLLRDIGYPTSLVQGSYRVQGVGFRGLRFKDSLPVITGENWACILKGLLHQAS